MTSYDQRRSMFKIMDSIINEVNKARKIFTILVLLSIIPIVGITISIVISSMGHDTGNIQEETANVLFHIVLVGILIIVIGFAIRQLIVLKKWTIRYKQFKKEQEEIIKKVDELDD